MLKTIFAGGVEDASPARRDVSLPQGMNRILLVSTQPWVFPARLCMALRLAGAHVEGASPSYGFLGHSAAPLAWHRLRPWRMGPDLARAVRRARPDRLVPCDDAATALLVALHADRATRSLVEASLGNSESYPVALSKGAQMRLATQLGVPIPPTVFVPDRAAFDLAIAGATLPCVLKVDGTFGGTGVAIVSDARTAGAAWDRLTIRPSVLAAAKGAVLERSVRPLMDRQNWRASPPHLQAFVAGTLANRAVVCERGRVVAGVSVTVLQTAGARGPSSVVQVVDHPGMAASAAAFVARLGLSGFHGFDFVLGPDDRALMLEMNPRATPICHLAQAGKHGLAAAMLEAMGTHAPPTTLPAPGETVALFPNEMTRDSTSPYLQGWHDVPCNDLPLLRSVLADIAMTSRIANFRGWLRNFSQRRSPAPASCRSCAPPADP